VNSRILKWGNSLAVRIPKVFADEMKVAENTSIQLTMKEGALRIAPLKDPQWDLDSLLADVTKDNLHDEWETGGAVGKERL
jgi:antitoxin MazE